MAKPSRRYAQDHAIYNLHTGPADSYVPQGFGPTTGSRGWSTSTGSNHGG